MQYTQAQIDRANAVSLEDFLRTQGETLINQLILDTVYGRTAYNNRANFFIF